MGYLALALSALSYAVGIVAQTIAARRTERRERLDVGLLARLAVDRVYLVGFAAQVAGFALAFLARATLPLYLVQAGASSAVGLAALLGALWRGWRIRPAEIGALSVMAVGLIALVAASQPSAAGPMPGVVGLCLVAALVLVVLLAVPAARLHGAPSAVALGVLAGLAFAVLAIASRPLAAGSLLQLPLQPLFWLMVVSAFIGQGLLASALQRGAPTTTMASMDATSVVVGSVVGLAVLGDQVAAGMTSLVAAGLTLVVAGVVAMAVLQPHPSSAPTPVRRIEKEATAG